MIDEKTLEDSVRVKKVLIDSNIIIYLTEEIEPYHKPAQKLFSLVENGSIKAVISILSVTEVMQGPLRSGRPDIAMAVKTYLVNFPNSICQHITFDVLNRVGADKNVDWSMLRTADSLIIASGLQAGVSLFVSNDRHFAKSLPPGMLLSFG
jgi:predicted nucleic acid-binding protein